VEDQSYTSCTGVLLAVAQSVSVAQHATCRSLGKHIGLVHDAGLSTGTCGDTYGEVKSVWTTVFVHKKLINTTTSADIIRGRVIARVAV